MSSSRSSSPITIDSASEDDVPLGKRPRKHYADIFEIQVGGENTKFIVHKALICPSSGYFNRQNPKRRKVTLTGFKCDVFDAYLHSIYTSKVDTSSMDNESNTRPVDTPLLLSLTKLWHLADYLDDPELCDELTDLLLDKVNLRTLPSSAFPWRGNDFAAAVNYAFEKTSHASELRMLFMDLLIVGMNKNKAATSVPQRLENGLGSVSQKALLELSKHLIQGGEAAEVRTVERIELLPKTKYHKMETIDSEEEGWRSCRN